jgi:hypothetical protein
VQSPTRGPRFSQGAVPFAARTFLFLYFKKAIERLCFPQK